MTLRRREWMDLARKLDWEFSYVSEAEVYPEEVSGRPWLPSSDWKAWEEPFRTSFGEYVEVQNEKDRAVYAVNEAIGTIEDYARLSPLWLNCLKFHSALFPLAEFDAVVGNLRAARFGRDSAWRTAALFGALDELRHTQIPLLLMHRLVEWDGQFDWTHRFYHTNNWIAIAARHCFDELLLTSNPIEFAIATNFVLETGFTNLQFVGLSSLAHFSGDRMFEKMITSIQTDEARHAQIGNPVLARVVESDPEYAQFLLDKWFWRSWLLFAILTGFAMDYFTPLESRKTSFKEFVQEWVLDQFLASLEPLGLKKPWYWETFLRELDYYHHLVYASAYSYRATTWFQFSVPSPAEREWLREKYPDSWPEIEALWRQIDKRWKNSDPGTEWGVHGATPVAFCRLCQLVLCNGTPSQNEARTVEYEGQRYIFCSEPCQWIFLKEPERYAGHKDVVTRILRGEAPANVLELTRRYFSLDRATWGKDLQRGAYSWIDREEEDRSG